MYEYICLPISYTVLSYPCREKTCDEFLSHSDFSLSGNRTRVSRRLHLRVNFSTDVNESTLVDYYIGISTHSWSPILFFTDVTGSQGFHFYFKIVCWFFLFWWVWDFQKFQTIFIFIVWSKAKKISRRDKTDHSSSRPVIKSVYPKRFKSAKKVKKCLNGTHDGHDWERRKMC